jgi:WD40 repeat protein
MRLFFLPVVSAALLATAVAQTKEAHLEIQLGHPVGIASVTFSSDDRLVLSVGTDAQAVLWDVGSGKELRRFPDENVKRAVFSPDDRKVLISSETGVVLRSATTSDEIRRFGDKRARSWLFSPDGTQVAAAVGDSVLLWDAESGKQIQVLSDLPSEERPIVHLPFMESLTPIAFANAHPWLLSCRPAEAALWDRSSGAVIRRIGIKETVLGCRISPDDALIVITAASGGNRFGPSVHRSVWVYGFSTSSGVLKWRREAEGMLSSLSISPDSKNVAFVTGPKNIHIVGSESGVPNSELERIARGRSAVFFDSRGQKWALAGGENQFFIDIISVQGNSAKVRLESKTEAIWNLCWSGEGVATAGDHFWSILAFEQNRVDRPISIEHEFKEGSAISCSSRVPTSVLVKGTAIYVSTPSADYVVPDQKK